MVYTCTYKSELGEILLAADEIGLTGLWFTGQKYFASTLPDEHISRKTPVLSEAKEWLDVYFSIIIPCHRVVGSNGSLTGYAGGMDKKVALLKLEHTDMSHFFIPKKGTAVC